MSRKHLAAMGALCLLSSSLFAQGLQTSATKDDWEEINFEFNSAILSDGYPSLLRLADLLKQHGDYKLQVEGHTDFVGSLPYNEKLALARASTVKDFLVKYGASAGAIATSGQGKRSPEVPNSTKEGRFINRRVVLTLRDGSGKVIGAGGVVEVMNSVEDRLKKLEDCCSAILKKLDKLDEILAAVRDLKNENDRLKSDIAGLKNQRPAAAAAVAPQMTPQQSGEIARSEVTKALEEQAAKNRKFSLLGVNVGPRTSGDISFTGKGRYFAPFGGTHAVQAEGEYMYFGGTGEKRQEGQFDLGLVNRFGNVQAGLFSSFKYINMSAFRNGGTLGQGAFTLDYIFKRGRVGVFGTKGFRDNVTVGRTQLGPASYNETYLSIVDQIGGSTQVGLFGDSYIEGNLGYLKRRGGNDRPGGLIRFVQPVSRQIAVTIEAGLNETLLAAKDSGRVVFGLQFGNWVRPKEFHDVTHPVPVDIPRIRYELLTRRVGNSAPVADAGPDQIGVAPGTIRLDGSGSYDPDGDPITYEWTQIAGPSVGLTGRNEKQATFTAVENQTYSFRLLVKDPGGLQSTARVTVTSQRNAQARVLRFLAQPNTIRQGQSSTLIWQVEGADTVEITGLGRVALSGTSVVSPRETTMYRLTARNANSEVNETVTVTVERLDVRIVLFQATPATVMAGEASMLTWQTENADRVEITGLGSVSPNGRSSVTPTQTTTYTITARGPSGNDVTATATVQVVAGRMPRIIRFVASPPEILPGEQSPLTWQVENATEIT
ncbi:MAG: OmpA family protein, partial [Bryobacteraceae bacterium]